MNDHDDAIPELTDIWDNRDKTKPCILDLDSPSYPPELNEYLQCGCHSCLEKWYKETHK